MESLVPSSGQLDVMRAIVGAGFDYSATKRLCSAAGWELVDDEPDLGFVQYAILVGPGQDSRRLLSVGTRELDGPPHIFLPLYYYEEGAVSGEHDRTPFDDAYRSAAKGLGEILGEARRAGKYEYPHRPGWPYNFRTWRVREAQIVLLQDELDIQFGMDVSLWLFAAEPEITIPLPY